MKPKTKTLPASKSSLVAGRFPNFHRSGSIIGMRRMFYGRAALLVRCGQYIYNVSSAPEIWYQAR